MKPMEKYSLYTRSSKIMTIPTVFDLEYIEMLSLSFFVRTSFEREMTMDNPHEFLHIRGIVQYGIVISIVPEFHT